MVLNLKSLGIGCAIGAAVTLSVILVFQQATGRDNRFIFINDNTRGLSINCEKIECIDFYLFAFVKDISSDSLSLVRSLDQVTDPASKPVITMSISEGSPLFWCAENQCERTTYDKIPIGSYGCAHSRLNPDGSFTVSRFFFNLVCTTQTPPDSDRDGLSDGCENQTKTDHINPDSDRDGVIDGDEDADNDGLTNREECDRGTDPLKA